MVIGYYELDEFAEQFDACGYLDGAMWYFADKDGNGWSVVFE
jgi:hypothetical protein